METIYRLFDPTVWASFQAKGEFTGTQVDIQDGFIHFSALAQVYATAMKHYKGHEGLILAAVPASVYDAALKWEISRGGAEFPHLYARLKLSDVSAFWQLPSDGQGGYIWPDFIPTHHTA